MEKARKEKIVSLAKSLIGKPYKYGAGAEEAPDYFDCSSFTQYIYKQIGIEIPRSTILQADFGKTIDLKNIEPGDLIFMHGTQGFYNKKFPAGIGHVILYTGGGKTIHAASKRTQEKPDIVEEGAVEERDLNYLLEKLAPLVVIKRIL